MGRLKARLKEHAKVPFDAFFLGALLVCASLPVLLGMLTNTPDLLMSNQYPKLQLLFKLLGICFFVYGFMSMWFGVYCLSTPGSRVYKITHFTFLRR